MDVSDFFCYKVDERRNIQSMFAGQKNIKRVLVLSSTKLK